MVHLSFYKKKSLFVIATYSRLNITKKNVSKSGPCYYVNSILIIHIL